MYDRILQILIESSAARKAQTRALLSKISGVPADPDFNIGRTQQQASLAMRDAGKSKPGFKGHAAAERSMSSKTNPFKPPSGPSGNKPNEQEIEAYRRKHLGRESGRSYGTHSMSDDEYLDYRAKHPANPRNWSKEDPESETYKNQEAAFLKQQNSERGFFKRKKQVDAIVASPAIGGKLGAMAGKAMTPNYNPARVGRTPRSFM